MNLQPWAFVVVQDRKLLKEFSDRSKVLVAKADKPAKLKERLTDPEFNIFYNAGTLIVICPKPARQHPELGLLPGGPEPYARHMRRGWRRAQSVWPGLYFKKGKVSRGFARSVCYFFASSFLTMILSIAP
jgi:nitroreductase